MAEEPRSHDRTTADGTEPSPQESLLHKTVPARVIAVVLILVLVAAVGVAAGYFIGHRGSPRKVTALASGGEASVTPSATVSSASQPSSAAPAVPTVIPMGLACKWAYPGQSSGQTSGSDYSIVCLRANGQVLGGFSGSHSLNAWCLNSHHTDNAQLPDAELVNGTWICSGSGSPGQAAPATSQPSQTASGAPSQPTPGQPAPTPPASPSSSGVPAAVPIPMGAACEWAYPGQANGEISGRDYSIVCLGANGQVLGGFSGSHSLNAWCSDPGHTDNKRLPSPELVDGEWLCTS